MVEQVVHKFISFHAPHPLLLFVKGTSHSLATGIETSMNSLLSLLLISTGFQKIFYSTAQISFFPLLYLLYFYFLKCLNHSPNTLLELLSLRQLRIPMLPKPNVTVWFQHEPLSQSDLINTVVEGHSLPLKHSLPSATMMSLSPASFSPL